MKRILIVDDDVAVTNFFRVFLAQTEQFESAIVNDSREVPGLLGREAFDVIVLDMDMPDVSGVDILGLMQRDRLRTPVVVLTGVGDVDLAVKAMKLGAFDYLTKPVEEEHLLEVLDNALKHAALHETLTRLPPELKREDLAHAPAFQGFVTQDERLIRVLHEAEKMAASDMTVLIVGEQGTGREELARALHAISPRGAGPFVAVDAGAHDREAFPAAFFGQARVWRGTTKESTGLIEEAEGGTLFLDHIERLDIPSQLRLRRLIQSGEFYRENSTRILRADVRLIAASSQDLAAAGYPGTFSRDLLYHLVTNTLRLPPLRARKGDIPLIAADALEREARQAGRTIRGFDPEVINLFEKYPFPDNDHELRAIVAAAVRRAEGETITVEQMPSYVREGTAREPAAAPAFEPRSLADVEREHVLRMLRFCGGDREKAAVELGVTVAGIERILGNG